MQPVPPDPEPISTAAGAAGRPKLRHVAELAGVSESTVSRVLNDRPGVAAETRRTVRSALHQLGYAPTRAAAARPTGLVGLIVPELDNPSFPRSAQGLEQALAEHGFLALLCTSTPSGRQEHEYVEVLVEHGVAGIVFVSGVHADSMADHGGYHDLLGAGISLVAINGRPDELPVPGVSADDRHAARTATEHLLALGHERIGLATGRTRFEPARRKLLGYRDALAAAGRRELDLVSESVYGREGGAAAARDLLDRGATGIVAASDLLALGVVDEARARGLSVPGDVSVIGYDDAGVAAWAGLTTMRQPFDAIAAVAVELLVEQLGGDAASTHEVLLPTTLIDRGTTGPPPGHHHQDHR